jgi:hypothetical protein
MLNFSYNVEKLDVSIPMNICTQKKKIEVISQRNTFLYIKCCHMCNSGDIELSLSITNSMELSTTQEIPSC